MGVNRKYLVAVALLAVLAVVFGLAGTVAPRSDLVSPQTSSSSSSDSVTHFMNPPTYNSSWLNITDKAGQYFNVTHNLNSTDVIVDITGKTTMDGGIHQINLGGAGGTLGFNKTYGGTSDEYAGSVIQTNDGGYAFTSITDSFGSGMHDIWLVKTSAAGNHQWNKTYGGASNDYPFHGLVQTSDGGYVLAGVTYSYGAGDMDGWLIKTDSAGIVEWNQTYGGSGGEILRNIIQTNDGGYLLVGSVNAPSPSTRDCWLVKTYSNGTVEWSKTYGTAMDEQAMSVAQTDDGGYAMVGYTKSYGAGNHDFWLVRTDASGNPQWNETYGGADVDDAIYLTKTMDGGFAIVGYTLSYGAGGNDVWLIKTDANGNQQWNKTYGGTGSEYGVSLMQTIDGGFAIVGSTSSIGAGDLDVWLIRTNLFGGILWSQTYGGGAEDSLGYGSFVQTADEGYAIVATTFSYGAGASDAWLVKTDSHGYLIFEFGLSTVDSTPDSITLCRGRNDAFWNYVCVRIWTIEEPTWQFGDINQDGIVDAQDLAILGKNYGKTFSALSLTGILAITSIYAYKERKKQPE